MGSNPRPELQQTHPESARGLQPSVGYMVSEGAPFPTVPAIIAIVMEFFVGIAIVIESVQELGR